MRKQHIYDLIQQLKQSYNEKGNTSIVYGSPGVRMVMKKQPPGFMGRTIGRNTVEVAPNINNKALLNTVAHESQHIDDIRNGFDAKLRKDPNYDKKQKRYNELKDKGELTPEEYMEYRHDPFEERAYMRGAIQGAYDQYDSDKAFEANFLNDVNTRRAQSDYIDSLEGKKKHRYLKRLYKMVQERREFMRKYDGLVSDKEVKDVAIH